MEMGVGAGSGRLPNHRRQGMASRDAGGSPRSAPRRHRAAVPKDGPDLLSPLFRSAAEQTGSDEESILPVRESRHKRRACTSTSSVGCSAGSSTRKRRPRRQPLVQIPPVVLALDDDDNKMADGKSEGKATKEEEKVVLVGDKEASGSGKKAAADGNMPCMDPALLSYKHHQHGRWQARIGRVAVNKDLYLGTFTNHR